MPGSPFAEAILGSFKFITGKPLSTYLGKSEQMVPGAPAAQALNATIAANDTEAFAKAWAMPPKPVQPMYSTLPYDLEPMQNT